MQAGGLIGTFGLAWVIARWGFLPTLGLTFALATVSIALIGQPGLTLTALGVIVFVAGWCVVGGQPAINALSATFYPTYLRSTGVGAGLGVGRTGAIIGPYLGGILLAAAVDAAAAVLGRGRPGAGIDGRHPHAAGRDASCRSPSAQRGAGRALGPTVGDGAGSRLYDRSERVFDPRGIERRAPV